MKRFLLISLFVSVAFIVNAQKSRDFYYAFRVDGTKCQITEVFVKPYADIVNLRERMEATDEIYDPTRLTVIIGPMAKEDAEEAQTRRKYALIGHFQKTNVTIVELTDLFAKK